MLHHHVVHGDAAVDHVGNVDRLMELHRSHEAAKLGTKSAKATFCIFSDALLPLRKALLVFAKWFGDRLDKARQPWVDAIHWKPSFGRLKRITDLEWLPLGRLPSPSDRTQWPAEEATAPRSGYRSWFLDIQK